jgi:hypothetical protein
MSLRCQLCGKEYYHDRKVCHTCEETANNSLLSHNDLNTDKWRCDNFLELKCLPFGEEGITHRKKLENKEYNWKMFTTNQFDKTELDENTINYFLRFE